MSRGELAAALSGTVDPSAMLQRFADRTLELLPSAQGVAVGIVDDDALRYVCGAGAGVSGVGTRSPLEGSLSGIAIQTGRVLRSHDTQRDPRVDAAACRRLSVGSLMCVPLRRSNEMLGAVVVNASDTRAFSDADLAHLSSLSDLLSDAVGSVCDLRRATDRLRGLTCSGEVAEATTTDGALPRALSPDTMSDIEARMRVQQVLDDPELLSVVFQPVVDLFSGDMVAVEALARFNRTPVRPPEMWFADARQVGLGVELEMLALASALAHLPHLPDSVALSINVAPDTMACPQLHRVLQDVPASRVVLELTEHAILDDHPDLSAARLALRKAGIRLAVDDAGSGSSSLTHLVDLAPDFIKIDRSLMWDLDVDPVRRSLVGSLVSFASEIGAEIQAEGVETIDELHAVRRLGVRYAQGYFLGRPAPLHAVRVEHRPVDRS